MDALKRNLVACALLEDELWQNFADDYTETHRKRRKRRWSVMNPFEEKLASEVKRYKHLYDSSSKFYKNKEVGMKCWREIGKKLDEDPDVCLKKWKSMRDKFVRLKKKLKSKSGNPGRRTAKVPAYYDTLSWLHRFVKHRRTGANVASSDVEVESGQCTPVRNPGTDQSPDPVMGPVEELDDVAPPTPTEQPAPSPALNSTVARELFSDDEDDEDDEEDGRSTPDDGPGGCSCQPARRTCGASRANDMLETIAALRGKQNADCGAAMGPWNGITQNSLGRDEFSTFALALADSLRKLPAERLEATKVKLFSVLGEAHASSTA